VKTSSSGAWQAAADVIRRHHGCILDGYFHREQVLPIFGGHIRFGGDPADGIAQGATLVDALENLLVGSNVGEWQRVQRENGNRRDECCL
jgi:hypothetical protein